MDAKVREEARKAAIEAVAGWTDQEEAERHGNDAIDAYEAALKAAGYVMVPSRQIQELCRIATIGNETWLADVAVSSQDHAEYDRREKHIATVVAMIEAATNPAP